ncbi:hypothetical protein D0C36_19465 [Mucilaginibacter conchicola]|uniref:HNH nuclease domain-containing protein n=1 Tax=Mucilaginibacter conchicola TaxID=2303333 RepID=A0A372NQC0_9SPHI|nr:HNH endonuclease domain-containing protein [Mucilaginibacter conchicola]RFZ91122.1 hypothetical protein D0C36_19465 [Mucilaginibacter conchicola]
MILPEHKNLPVHLLASCFNSTVASYKFYWFLSLIDQVETGKTVISKQDLFAGMVANAWYTVNYFKVSFGVLDKLQEAVHEIRTHENLTIDCDRRMVFTRLSDSADPLIKRKLRYFNGEVPHRFLSPWLRASDKNHVYAASRDLNNQCLYGLYNDHIEVNPDWFNYLREHAGILRKFCYWTLALFLQSKNPNVPDIPNKLIKSPVRKSLNEQRKFWDIVLGELGSVDCIYTGKKLIIGDYAVEHFLPYAFVSHDLMWNLIPADRSFNSSKSDKLPPLDKYFGPFFDLQQNALNIVKAKAPKNKLLEDYLTIIPDLSLFERQRVFDQINPIATIAINNGFEYLRS